MKRIVIFSLIAGALFVGAVSSPLSGLARFVEGRSGSELSLFLVLNGERVRPTQADAGGLTLYTVDAGIASITVSGGSVYYMECPTTACHVCSPGPDGITWDGGCSNVVGDPNYGSLITSGGYRYISTRDSTTTIKGVAASGSANCVCPTFIMR